AELTLTKYIPLLRSETLRVASETPPTSTLRTMRPLRSVIWMLLLVVVLLLRLSTDDAGFGNIRKLLAKNSDVASGRSTTKVSIPMMSELSPEGPPLVTKYLKANFTMVGPERPEIVADRYPSSQDSG